MNAENISMLRLSAGYLLFLIPLSIMLWYGVGLVGKTIIAILRMTVQLLFVGLYLQVVFEADNAWFTVVWLFVMMFVADISILRHCDLQVGRFWLGLFGAMVVGTLVPLLYFVEVILTEPGLLEAQYVIPIGGMILGNCLRANVIGVSGFYHSIRKNERPFLLSLAYGASLREAIRPYFRDAFRAALLPTVTSMSTIGLVSLPGMMTGVILGGADPMTAIRYQIAIIIAIFTGTSITVFLGVFFTAGNSFSSYGVLDKKIFVS